MKKYYDFDTVKATIETTPNGMYKTTVKDVNGLEFENVFALEINALYEILSYAETDENGR